MLALSKLMSAASRPAGTGGGSAGCVGPRGALGELLGAQEALLRGGDEADGDGAPRRLGQRLEGAGDGEQLGAAGCVVAGAVVDAVAGGVGLADAEVVVMGGEDHPLLRELRVAAGDLAHHVGGLDAGC